MVSEKERNRLAAQAWAAQAEAEWKQQQEEKARQNEEIPTEKPACRFDLELCEALLSNQVKYLGYISQLFNAVAAIGVLLALQAIALGYLVAKGWR
ncbi:MAG: hypothetical protein IJV46_06900 [Acidaminococcaceae bacterium]|nr:hypothetical protein [Acidaminococcaceae bacterium]